MISQNSAQVGASIIWEHWHFTFNFVSKGCMACKDGTFTV